MSEGELSNPLIDARSRLQFRDLGWTPQSAVSIDPDDGDPVDCFLIS